MKKCLLVFLMISKFNFYSNSIPAIVLNNI